MMMLYSESFPNVKGVFCVREEGGIELLNKISISVGMNVMDARHGNLLHLYIISRRRYVEFRVLIF